MGTGATRSPKVPPASFEGLFWRAHRWLHRISGGRFLWKPGKRFGLGAMGLTTIGRRSGQPRTVIVGYVQDGSNPVVLAMNGWQEGHPSWWLNLEAHPTPRSACRARSRGPGPWRGRAGNRRDRLWQLWGGVDEGLDGLAARRAVETPVVVFEPRT